MGQFHLDVDSYLGMMRAEVPAYEELQALVGRSTAGIAATRVLDLGTGTGETADAVLAPGGRFVMLDVVIPPKRPERPVPLEVGVDLPSTVEDLVLWLSEAGLEPRVEFAEGDLAVVSADEA